MHNIIHLVWGFGLGGIETMLVNIINEQVCSGANVSLIIINNIVDEGLVSRIDKRVKVVYIGRKPKSRNLLPLLKLNIILLKIKPTVIHCHSHTIIKYLLPTLHKRTVVTIHNTTVVKSSAYLDRFSRIFVISNAVKEELYENFGINSEVVYNGIDFTKILPRTSPISSGRLNIVQIGRLTKQKGHYISIESINRLQHLDLHLDIIGDGELKTELEEMVSGLRLSEKITFLGAKSQGYIFSHLKDYDLLIQPSLWEGFGLTAVEAMAAKIPVLASNIDGLGEIMQQGRYGECFDMGNIEQCVKALKRLYDNPYSKEHLDTIYSYVNSNFNVRQTASRYLKLYEKI